MPFRSQVFSEENGYRNVTSCKVKDYEESHKNSAKNLTVKNGSVCKSWRKRTGLASVYHYLSLPFILFPSLKV